MRAGYSDTARGDGSNPAPTRILILHDGGPGPLTKALLRAARSAGCKASTAGLASLLVLACDGGLRVEGLGEPVQGLHAVVTSTPCPAESVGDAVVRALEGEGLATLNPGAARSAARDPLTALCSVAVPAPTALIGPEADLEALEEASLGPPFCCRPATPGAAPIACADGDGLTSVVECLSLTGDQVIVQRACGPAGRVLVVDFQVPAFASVAPAADRCAASTARDLGLALCEVEVMQPVRGDPVVSMVDPDPDLRKVAAKHRGGLCAVLIEGAVHAVARARR
ncbi:hypothetical protein ACFL59_04020 [Planctomycetota bacterium]